MRLLGFAGACAGSALGWWAGSPAGVMTAFLASTIAGGLGLYYGRRLGSRLME